MRFRLGKRDMESLIFRTKLETKNIEVEHVWRKDSTSTTAALEKVPRT
jgi:hypothetical protein